MRFIPPGYKVIWKRYPLRTMSGHVTLASSHSLTDNGTRFLHEIEAMPPGVQVTFLEARYLFHQAYREAAFGDRSDAIRACWLNHHWVEWLQQQGYQIVLTGAEWELVEGDPVPPPDHAEVSRAGYC